MRYIVFFAFILSLFAFHSQHATAQDGESTAVEQGAEAAAERAAEPPSEVEDRTEAPADEGAEAETPEPDKEDVAEDAEPERAALSRAANEEPEAPELALPASSGKFDVTNAATTTGALTYEVDIKVPEFRGLEPDLGLTYASSDKMYGDSAPVYGVGWRLKGASSITRVAETGGIPSYRDGFDVWRLDGMDLLACRDAAATNILHRNYPEQFRTTRRSASCASGGKLATLQDNFKKIDIKSDTVQGAHVDRFVITDKSGVRYIYKAAGILAGVDLPASDSRFKVAFQRKFLLAEVRDRQQIPNVVTYQYDFGPLGEGLPERLKQISYGGYSVQLHYQRAGKPRKTYAVGHDTIFGKQFHILSAVSVHDRSSKIRAYRLAHEVSETTYQRRLKYFQEFGSNFEITNGAVTGGTGLPPYVFDHTDGALTFSRRVYAGKHFHANADLTDLDNDGRTDINMMFTRFHGRYSKPKAAFEIQNDRGIAGTGRPLPGNDAAEDSGLDTERRYESRSVWTVVEPGHYESYWTYEIECGWVLDWRGNRTFKCEQIRVQKQRWVNDRYGFVTVWEWVTYYRGWASGWSRNVLASIPEGLVGATPHFLSIGQESFSGYYQNYNRAKLYLQRQEGNIVVTKREIVHNIGACKYGGDKGQDPVLIGNFDRDKRPEVVFGETIFNVDDGALNRSPLTDGFGSYCEKAHHSAAAVDLNGDGVDEILAGDVAFWNENGALVRKPLANSPFTAHVMDSNGDENRVIRFGDVNGDGAEDALLHNRNGDVFVRLSTGTGFLPNQKWIDRTKIATFGFMTNEFGSPRTQLTDINGDGVDDLILHDGYERNTHKLKSASNSRAARIFISVRDGFVEYTGTHNNIPNFVGAGDVDGDGQVDLVSEGTDGVVYYNNSGPRNLIVKIGTPMKAELEVTYLSTRESPFVKDDKVPGVTHVVRQIDVLDGRGQRQVNQFWYTGSAYDYRYRRTLGFAERKIRLPRLGNETKALERTDTYFNDHIGRAGLMRNSRLMYNGNLQAETVINWAVQSGGKGPFTNQIIRKTEGMRYHDRFLRTAETYTNTEFGERALTVELGPVKADGTDVTPDDNAVTKVAYVPNRDLYIVNKPVYEWRGSGAALSWDRTNWVTATFYHYDETARGSHGWNVAPVRGNLTSTRKWNGVKTGDIALRWDEFKEIGLRGNVISMKNARNAVTRYTYDTVRHLFVVGETDPLGHTTQTKWSHTCQDKAETTDPNAQVTRFTYDVFCRRTLMQLPNGGYERKYYRLNNAQTQHVETRVRSASIEPNEADTVEREYFDGLGRIHKTGVSGEVSAISALIYTNRWHDQRDNLAWESIPLTAAEAGQPVHQDLRTTFVFDPLNREIVKREPNGAHVKTLWRATMLNGAPYYKSVLTDDARCFDNPDLNTVCGRTRRDYDYRDNMVYLFTWDYDKTDVGQVAHLHRKTTFKYDVGDRLIQVVDPIGIGWTFTYDGFGNRLTQDDPSLGLWTFTYDNADNQKTRRDAKGQVISKTYDAADRVIEKRVTGGVDGTKVTRFTYDQPRANAFNIGQLTTVTLGGHKVEYDYTRVGKVAREWHTIDNGRRYVIHRQYRHDGSISRMHLPTTPGQTKGAWTPYFRYDAANRLDAVESLITNIVYDLNGNAVKTNFDNGWTEGREFARKTNLMTRVRTYDHEGSVRDSTSFERYPDGRIKRRWMSATGANTHYTYDYAGRLLTARDEAAATHRFKTGNRTFAYDRAGRMRSNSVLGAYEYTGSPVIYSPLRIAGEVMSYDANGNLVKGRGRTITYDGENRPITVVYGNKEVSYTYGADGLRLKTVVKTISTGKSKTTITFGPVEIRDYGGTGEQVLTHPVENVRLMNGDLSKATYLFRDNLDSVRMTVGQDRKIYTQTAYTPHGKPREWVQALALPDESHGFIGERFDDDSGLSFLNARYYDPVTGLFTQPDWLDVTEDGVGTNRFAYSYNDPINLLDPGGNQTIARGGGTARRVDPFNGGYTHSLTPLYNARGTQLTSQLNVYNFVLGRPLTTSSLGNFTPNSLARLENSLMHARLDMSLMSRSQISSRLGSLGLSAPVSTARFSSLYSGSVPGVSGTVYFGITYNNTFGARQSFHSSNGLLIQAMPGFRSLTRDYARVYEQIAIESMGGARSMNPNTSLFNSINSVSPRFSHRNSTIDSLLSSPFSFWTSPRQTVPSYAYPF